ncbi:ABC transporter substrate-binding protein [Streptosporangium roseum]|uniref:ABC-type nitrate/sulfonate/bicarbonate transport systems periplasmic components-like protein n=1 Tax=Streptosporangium roseum (strain ATCC 12428 / DSM 43021 / JCM 3005 / KCTC 9067 / NCIMB 10171 / NRRL 2505 / NI 9100) TaxID=479432 RepID=D2ATC7_STRRD|nr:ABC transporter substrate-binding protein [Streptosporangium roseum]ACZ84803.1 ABC-type nitrate/sulfonate/bicarbonate transport systems periplasmic components-like protein [Streptosporangium roseum DSM 43021]
MGVRRACLAGLVAALALSACGGVDGGAARPSAGDGPEKTEITVGVVPVPSAAPLFIAIEKGFFKEEGLTVRTETIQAPQAVMPKILNGGIDTFLTSYVSLITIQDSGVAKLKMLVESQQGAPGVNGVLVTGDSPLKEIGDLRGKKIAVNVVKALGEVATSAHLKAAGLTPADVSFVPVPFAEQLAALRAGRVDAAWTTEPYISAAKKDLSARVLVDTLTGPTEGLPLDGWAASADWTARNPKTAAAFQRALGRAQKLAAADRSEIDRVIPSFTKIPADVAAAMTLATFSTSLDAARIQRVADLMSEFGLTRTRIDATALVAG